MHHQGRLLTLVFAVAVLGRPGLARGAEPDDVNASLARAPRPWSAPMYRFSRDEYEETLRYWAEKHAKLLTLQTRGLTREKMPIYLLRISDNSVPDAGKQVCLITALHSGPERSPTTTLLHFIPWLLGDSPEAAEVRHKQIVLVMPIVNPYAFFVTDRFGNSQGIDPYTGMRGKVWDPKTFRLTCPDKSPELAAFASVVDEYRPEVHADMHGIGLQEYPGSLLGDRHLYGGQTMFESSGSAYSNFALRPWDWRVTEAMVKAARDAGYGSDRYEADGQRVFAGPGMAPVADRVWSGAPFFYSAHYGYAKYHTMILAMEIGWEESGVARLKGLLRLGNEVWEGEPVAGYPVDRLHSFCGHFLVAYGATADQRRKSRAELWQRQGSFTHAMLYPQTDCRDSYIVALTSQSAKLLNPDKAVFLANLKNQPGIRAEAIRAFLQAGPEAKLYVEQGPTASAAPSAPIEHGMALRLRIPYRKPQLLDLRLNGHPIPPGTGDGYQAWYADGYTQVQINIPPQKAKANDLVIVTCAYAPDCTRTTGWKPPQEVLDRLKRRGSATGPGASGER
jgi:hypothetical protein